MAGRMEREVECEGEILMSIRWLDALVQCPGCEGKPFGPSLEIEPSFHWFPLEHARIRKQHAVIRTSVRARIGGGFSRGLPAREPGRRQGNQATRRNSGSISSAQEGSSGLWQPRRDLRGAVPLLRADVFAGEFPKRKKNSHKQAPEVGESPFCSPVSFLPAGSGDQGCGSGCPPRCRPVEGRIHRGFFPLGPGPPPLE